MIVKTARLLTEFVGTFVFLCVIALSKQEGALAPLAIGAILAVMVYMGGHVSGGHYNPAVSLGAFLRHKLDVSTLVAYWAVQIVAGALAFLFAYSISGHTPGISPGPAVSWPQAVAAEAVFTTALVLVVLNTAATKATEGNSFYGLAIGFTVMCGAFAVGPISGAAFNPAVGLAATWTASLLAHGGWSHLWIYLVGPLAGSVIAAGVHKVQVSALERLETMESKPT